MSPFQLLEVTPAADEREIKRAYARLLKRTRPDDDAVAFQRLQEAYARCLDIARNRVVVGNDGEHGEDRHGRAGASLAGDDASVRPAGEPRPPAPGSAPTPPGDETRGAHAADHGQHYFDVAAFAASLQGLLGQDSPKRMQEWLYAQESLYSVQLKQALRPAVVQAIEQAPRIGHSRVLDALLAFFGLDRLDHDGLADRVQTSLERRYRRERLDEAVRNTRPAGQSWLNRRIAAELAGPHHVLRRLFLLLVPMIPRRIRDLLERLRGIDPVLQHSNLDPGAVAFWMQASDPVAFNRPRLVMIGLRVATWNAALFGWLALVLNDSYPDIWHAAGHWVAGSAGLWAAYALARWAWFNGARWAIQRLGLLPEEYTALFTALLGTALSWGLARNPFPALIGGIYAYGLMIRTLSIVPRLASIAMAVASVAAWGSLTVPMEGRIDPETRASLVLTLPLIPLLAAPVMRRWHLRPRRWSAWLLAQTAALVLSFGALALQ
ncbi:MAG: J domain-containing protein [Pseudoxanthomonas sp.]|nr:J domain-containing protein [Pseudoxanthomonas sp.]